MQNNSKGLLIILSGPSGVGKGSIRRRLFMEDDLKLVYSISMTTREPRMNEIDGVDYFFVTRDEFAQSINEGDLIEYSEFVGNFYGTPKSYVERLLNEGKNVLLEIEVNGAQQVVKKMPNAITIFLMPPSLEELERRIRGRRTESEEIVQERLAKAAREMKLQDKYKHVVFNDDLETASLDIAKIIRSYM